MAGVELSASRLVMRKSRPHLIMRPIDVHGPLCRRAGRASRLRRAVALGGGSADHLISCSSLEDGEDAPSCSRASKVLLCCAPSLHDEAVVLE